MPDPGHRYEAGALIEASPGIYHDPEAKGVVILHLRELCDHLGLPQTQEYHASIYGMFAPFYERHGLEVVLVRDEDLPSERKG